MKLIEVLKVCVLAAFIATVFTGIIFVMQSSDDDKSIYGNSVGNKAAVVHKSNKELKGADYAEKNKDVDFVDVQKESEVMNLPKIKTKESFFVKPTTPLLTKSTTPTLPNKAEIAPETIAPKVLNQLKQTSRTPSVHIFYYPWYGSPDFNGKYSHWNHFRLKPDNKISNKPEDQHRPPGDIASSQYPLLGPYSSRDPAVIERHMKWLSSAGVDVVSVSWYPKEKADESGVPSDSLMPTLLNMTDRFKMKLNFHLEPYEGRSAISIRQDIAYIIGTYGNHPAFYRTTPKKTVSEDTKHLPLFYIYDSYKIGNDEWEKILLPNASMTIRNTSLDALMIGLYVKEGDELSLKKNGFDGLYTYFAAEGFTHGSTVTNWPTLSTFCAKENLLFIPSVGPGYDDSAVRPWNTRNSRPRENGDYYKEHFKMAHTAKADIVSITSFNEWHEGTQIEPAVPFTDTNGTGFVYKPYEKGPEQYLEITLEMIKTYFTPHHENIPMQIARVV